MSRHSALITLVIVLAGCHTGAPGPVATREAAGSRYLFVWAGDSDKRESDFLAVVDVDRQSPTYAQVLTTLPVGAVGAVPHHTEYEMPAAGELWANGFAAGRTFRLDLHDPRRPRLAGSFRDAGPFSHPHSYARLPSGHVLATFQHRAGEEGATGGLVELDTAGRVVRYAAAAAPAIDSTVRPYSLVVVPAIDRVVTTGTDMHLQVRSRAVQVWRLSDLTLLHTLLLPPGPRGDENWLTAEPRVLADGRTVLVNTFTCGLYRLRGLEGDAPSAEWVYSSSWEEGRFCAVPVVAGRFWIQTSGPEHSIMTLDVSDSERPREVSRLTLGPDQVPHWIALEPAGDRLVITGYRDLAEWVLLADFDRATGALAIDTTFKPPGAARPGVDFGRERWPHGATGPALPMEPCSLGMANERCPDEIGPRDHPRASRGGSPRARLAQPTPSRIAAAPPAGMPGYGHHAGGHQPLLGRGAEGHRHAPRRPPRRAARQPASAATDPARLEPGRLGALCIRAVPPRGSIRPGRQPVCDADRALPSRARRGASAAARAAALRRPGAGSAGVSGRGALRATAEATRASPLSGSTR